MSTQEQGTALIVVPITGEAIDLATAPPETLAQTVEQIGELRSELNEIDGALRVELVRRLDKGLSWTKRFRIGDVEYEVKAPSPEAGTVAYDAPALEERLRQHVAADDLDADAADAALERTVTVTFKVPISEDRLEAVAEAMKDARDVTIAGVAVEVAAVSSQRKVRAAGMKALAKVPALKQTVEEVTVTLPTPMRKASVSAKRKGSS